MSGDNNLLPGQERVLRALEESARVTVQITSRMDLLEERVDGLKDEMRSVNSHLDNISREAATTNSLLKEDIEGRKESMRLVREAEAKKQEKADAQTLQEQKEESAKNEFWRKMIHEVWTLFKQPLAYLLVGVVAYILYYVLAVPPNIVPIPELLTTPEVEKNGAPADQ